jgi:hypothetical protein
MSTFDNNTDVIDSRDIIERIEELEAQLDDNEITPEELEELTTLRALAEECEGCSDWEYGAQLIRDSYFTDYIEELITDCYELPKELTSGEWPYRHITVDYEAAADEAAQDYAEVDYDGVTYLIRA